MSQSRRVPAESLKTLCKEVFRQLAVSEEDARITADVLVTASLRGVDSHGVARLRRYYTDGLQSGMIVAQPNERIVAETAGTALIDAGAGLGMPVSYRAMQMAMAKADATGVGVVTVRNSNHYGIAGYYAMMALEQDMIGISLTNADVNVVPTFANLAMIGTNPIAVAAPAGEERAFVLDMATSVAAVGKSIVARDRGQPIPKGWATDETGALSDDPARVLQNIAKRQPGGMLPLGGLSELLGGHKGYGLGLMVEILSAVLPGAASLDETYPKTADGESLPADLGHFFGAIKVAAFRPLDAFKASVDDVIRRLRQTPRVDGAPRIYIAGEKEHEEAEQRRKTGIPLDAKTEADLKRIAEELDISVDF
jgi:LDH2 family malate/lactate/ureidoglycolate dehydrogenase